MRVLFVKPPIQLPKVFAHYPMFSNIGMLANAALARERGHEVSVIDAFFLKPRLNYRPIDGTLFHVGAEVKDIEAEMRRRPADVVIIVITMFSDVYKLHETYVRELAEAARRAHPKAHIMAADCYVCGMNYFPYDAEKLMAQVPQIDSVLIGEGDHKLMASLERIAKGQKLAGIGKIPPIAELDELPYPAYDLLDMEVYESALADAVRLDLVHEYHKPERFLALMTSRGCKYSCKFCTQQVLGMPWRGHSVPYLKKMILHFKKRFKIERFFFIDGNINLEKERFRGLVRFLAKEKIAWDAVNGYRADRLTAEDIALIKKAGNSKLTVSAESGDPEVLSGIVNKRLDLKSVISVVKNCQAAGLPSQVHYIIGMPGEDKKQMNRTLEFAQALYELHGAWPLLQHAIPFRGTALYRECEKRGYFAEHPDKLGGWTVEQRSVIKTDKFAPQDVMRMKALFRHILDALDTVCLLDLGQACNNACAHCELKEKLGQGHGDLLARLAARKKAGARDLLIWGGEPMLDPAMAMRLARAAVKAGYVRRILATNARAFVYGALADKLAAAGINQVFTSLNAHDAAMHDAATRAPGSFLQTVAGIRNLQAAGIKDIDLTIRLTAQNLPFLAETVAFAKSLGLRCIHLRYPTPLADPSVISPFAEGRSKVVAVLEKFPDLDISVSGIPFCLMPDRFRDKMAPLPVFDLERIRRLKSKPEECVYCPDYIACLGFYRQEYEPYYRQHER